MKWKRCSGSGQPAMRAGGGKVMCPVCTKYVSVKEGQSTPTHEAVVINSKTPKHFKEGRPQP